MGSSSYTSSDKANQISYLYHRLFGLYMDTYIICLMHNNGENIKAPYVIDTNKGIPT